MLPDDDFRDICEQLPRERLALQAVIKEVQYDDIHDVDHPQTVDGPRVAERLEERPYIAEIGEIEVCRALDPVVPELTRGRQVGEIVPSLMLLVIEHEKRCRDGLIPMTAELRAIQIDTSLAAVIDLAELPRGPAAIRHTENTEPARVD